MFFLQWGEADSCSGGSWTEKEQVSFEPNGGEVLPHPPDVWLRESVQWYHAAAGKPPDTICFSVWWKWKRNIIYGKCERLL